MVRVLLFFNPEPLDTGILFDEPLNTILFFTYGLLPTGLYVGQRLWKRGTLIRRVNRFRRPEDLLELSPNAFEELTAELLRAHGYKAKRTGAVGDHGVDVVAVSNRGEKYVVQCKRWRGYVRESVVRDLHGVIHHEKADKGMVVTSGKFSCAAREWAKGKPIILCDGEHFVRLWQRAQAERGEMRKLVS